MVRYMNGWMDRWKKEAEKWMILQYIVWLMFCNLQGSNSRLLALSGGETIPSGFHDFSSKMRNALQIYHHITVIAGNNHHKLSTVPISKQRKFTFNLYQDALLQLDDGEPVRGRSGKCQMWRNGNTCVMIFFWVGLNEDVLLSCAKWGYLWFYWIVLINGGSLC